jgi:succinylglutamic semialdehyde dehydrogenase
MSGRQRSPGDLVNGVWRDAAANADATELISRNPATPTREVFVGHASVMHVDMAVDAARGAAGRWRATPVEKRFAALNRFAAIAEAREEDMTRLIHEEVGKVIWDARAEAKLLAAKVRITLDTKGAWSRVAGFEAAPAGTKHARATFKPHGVAAVLGPFNFPAHLPNGHIVPALAAGNTVVFKPSDKSPAVGRLLGAWLHEAIAAEIGEAEATGVVNVVQGGAEVAKRIVAHEHIDAILFTGSWPVGRAILQANLDRPGRLVALEMGGNNPAIVMSDADPVQALTECVRCAFISTGQRCTCTRRLIVQRGSSASAGFADQFIAALCASAAKLVVSDPANDSAGAFMGPLVTEGAMRDVLAQVGELGRCGAKELLACRRVEGRDGWFVTPGVYQVDRFEAVGPARSDAAIGPHSSAVWPHAGADEEIFGPVLRVCVVETLDEAIEQANATRFGLAASIFTRDDGAIARFLDEVRAGCLNVNTGTAGASSALPFGGLGLSGNHRPAGAFSVDYCAYPVASMHEHAAGSTGAPGMTIEW